MRVLYAQSFGDDLDAIADYIGADNPERAMTFVAEIAAVCINTIVAHPHGGRARPEYGPHMRSFVTNDRTIFYSFEPMFARLKFCRVIGGQDVSRESFEG